MDVQTQAQREGAGLIWRWTSALCSVSATRYARADTAAEDRVMVQRLSDHVSACKMSRADR